MSTWLTRVIDKVHELAARGRVRFTHKALNEIATIGMGLDEEDACRILSGLEAGDSVGRISSETNGEWMYIFMPHIAGTRVYLKLVLRTECVVVSFHEDTEVPDG
jgi:hypothetical protein